MNYHDIQIKYAGQIISVHFTEQQRVEYEKLDAFATVAREEFLFHAFTPLPRAYCTALAVNGDWNIGNWFDIAIPLNTLGERSDNKTVVRNMYEVCYNDSLVQELWCGLRSLSIDNMVKTLKLPRIICEAIYDFHETEEMNGCQFTFDISSNTWTVKR